MVRLDFPTPPSPITTNLYLGSLASFGGRFVADIVNYITLNQNWCSTSYLYTHTYRLSLRVGSIRKEHRTDRKWTDAVWLSRSPCSSNCCEQGAPMLPALIFPLISVLQKACKYNIRSFEIVFYLDYIKRSSPYSTNFLSPRYFRWLD